MTGLGHREQRRLAGGPGVRAEGPAADLRHRVDAALARREQSAIVELPAFELTTDGERPGADKALILPVDDTGEGSATLALVCGLSRHRPLDGDLRRFCELVCRLGPRRGVPGRSAAVERRNGTRADGRFRGVDRRR